MSRLISGNNYWRHIQKPIEIDGKSILIKDTIYRFDEVKILKFKIGQFEIKKPFMYKHILKDNRNLIKLKTQKDIINIYIDFKDELEYQKLKEIKSKLI